MKLRLKRIALRSTYTIGRLEVLINGDWKHVADTLEDKVRDLNKSGKFDCGEMKVYGETAIPYGTYKITMSVRSPKYSNFNKYKWAKLIDGYIPRLVNVPNFEGILIHPGNTSKDSLGCILVGKNKVVGKVVESQMTWKHLMLNYFIPAKERGEEITIEII